MAVGNVSPFFFECVAHHGEIIIEKCRRGQLIHMVNDIKGDHAIERMIERACLSRKHTTIRSIVR